MVNLDNIEYEFYIRNNRKYIDIENNRVNEYINPLVIVAKERMNIKAKWEISKMPSEELLKKNNIDPRTRDFKILIPISIEDNYKRYESSYTEEEKELLRNLLSKCFKLSEDKLNEIFGYKDIITEMKNTMQPIAATEFKLLKIYDWETSYFFKTGYVCAENKIIYDEQIRNMYFSSIINGHVGEVGKIWEDNGCCDSDTYYCSIDNLYGYNREDLVNYNFLYSTRIEKIKGREYIIFIILDRIPKHTDRILYFAPIEYPKDSELTITEVIENYIYNTFYTVSEPIQRRFITFLQRYCNKDNKQYQHMKTMK